METMFFNNFTAHPPITPEVNSGEVIVEAAGYVPAEIQIRDMIDAGQRLADARKQLYDYESLAEDDGVTTDPTRSPGFDLADASRMALGASARLEQVQKDQKAKKDREKHAEEAQRIKDKEDAEAFRKIQQEKGAGE